jgi:hypothetical protein
VACTSEPQSPPSYRECPPDVMNKAKRIAERVQHPAVVSWHFTGAWEATDSWGETTRGYKPRAYVRSDGTVRPIA